MSGSGSGSRIVKSVRFEGDGRVKVVGVLDDGQEESLIAYYSDEIHFVASDFVGKTVEAARELHMKRDVAYLRS